MEVQLVTLLTLQQAAIWRETFNKNGIERPLDYYFRCLEDNRSGNRITLFAQVGIELTGCGHLLLQSGYPHFRQSGIPEIQDLNVLPAYRRQGIGSKLLDELERLAAERVDTVGVGVGLYKDYGPAQRLYFRRGYVPDGNGVHYDEQALEPGASVRLDDALILYMTKAVKHQPPESGTE